MFSKLGPVKGLLFFSFVFSFSNTLYRKCRDQDYPQEKEIQKGKWLSEEALQIAVNRRETKGKGEKGSYNNLNESSKE